MSEAAAVLDERKEWLESRTKGLGGTDISAVVGMNPWKTAIDVYLGKLGLSEPKDVTEPMEWGTYQEQGIRSAYERRTNWKVEVPTLLHHPQVQFVLGTPDGIVPDAARGLEIKTSAFKTSEWGKPGSDEVPVHYSLQCAQYMAITGLEVWDLAVLFSGNRLEIFTLRRNPEIEEQILAAAKWFWETHVVPKVPPPVDGSESYTRYLAKKYALGSQTYIEPTNEIVYAATSLRDAQLELKLMKERERIAKNLLGDFIGENKGVKLPDGSRADWVRPKPQLVTDWEGLARRYTEDPEQIAEFTEEKPSTPYIRLYEATANQRRLKK